MHSHQSQYKVAIIGSNMMDLITYYDDSFPKVGETIFGKDFEIGFGGKGANQAVAIAKLGGNPFVVTAVGNDLFGPLVKENFKNQGIDTTWIKTVDGKTSGVAPIFVDKNGYNSIFIIPGANSYLEPEDIFQIKSVLTEMSFFLLQLEIKLDTVYAVLDLAHELGKKVILNPAPARNLDWKYLEGIYLFAPNETELHTLTGVNTSSRDDILKGAHLLLEKGVQNVLVTLGEKGSLLVNNTINRSFPAYPVKSIDTTGAGDAFIGALVHFLCQGKGLEESIDKASGYAALSTTQRGTQKSFTDRETFEHWFSQQPKEKDL
jgi:ribokinase